jgi:Tfp pilus assembly protein PilF
MDGKKYLVMITAAVLIAGMITPAYGSRTQGRFFLEITDTKGKPLKDVQVTLVSQVTDTRTYKLDLTDKKGKTRIVGVEPELFDIRCEKEGYQPLEGTVKLRPGVNVEEEWVMRTLEEAKEEARQKILDSMTEEERNKILAEEAHNEGLTALEQDDTEKARELFEKAIEIDPDVHYMTHLILGQFAFNDHDADKALGYLQKAYELDTEKEAIADIGSLLGATYMIKGEAGKAREVWAEEIQYEPKPLVLYNLAGIEVRAGDLDAAEKWLTMSVEKFPDHIDSIRLLGDIFINKDNYPKALEMYEKLEKAMEKTDNISPEELKEVKDTIQLLKETVNK